jgi:aminoglycoside 2'-N-acetyltransferase I
MPMTPRVDVRRTADLSDRDRVAIRALLDAAYAGEFSDDDWAHAIGGAHLIVEADGGIVAHASVVARVIDVGGRALRTGYVEAVAVRPELQRTGLGSEVMRAAGELIARDFELGALSSGEWDFYARLGWERWRGPTSVRHAGGQVARTPRDDDSVMILRVPLTPSIDLAAPITCDDRPGDPW